jgi:hypothetical protein
MPVSTFFDFYKNKPEQNLVEDLCNETINIFGFNGYYIPRDNIVLDDLMYGDSPLKKFSAAFPLAMRLSNQVDPGMNNDFFGKFGLEIKNNVRIELTRREFTRRVPRDTHTRPKEGDLVYIPHLSGTGELYEIKYVNDSTDRFTLGREMPYYWELELELFKYNHEDMDTGVEDIDVVETQHSFAIDYILGSGSGNYEQNEIAYQGTVGSPSAFGTVQGWDKPTKTLKLTNMFGVFASNTNIIGSESSATYTINSFDELNNPQKRDAWDNFNIENETTNIIDKSESNPFGML